MDKRLPNSVKNIKINDNCIPVKQQDLIIDELLKIKFFPWFYCNDGTRQDKESSQHRPALSHYFIINKKQHRIFKNHRLDGKWIEWHSNGIKRSEGNMKYEMMQGKWTFWYHNGKKELEFNLDFGNPVGTAKIYHDNGTVKEVVEF